MTTSVTGNTRHSIEIAQIAILACVHDEISTCLIRLAVIAAPIDYEYAVDQLSIEHITVVAKLAEIYGAIAAPPGINADRLIGCADLPWPANDITTEGL
jgi:hypothetical protein